MFIKTFFKKMLTTVQSPEGELSSKRIYGLGCFVVSVVLAFSGGTAQVVSAFLAAASAVFIAQSISKT